MHARFLAWEPAPPAWMLAGARQLGWVHLLAWGRRWQHQLQASVGTARIQRGAIEANRQKRGWPGHLGMRHPTRVWADAWRRILGNNLFLNSQPQNNETQFMKW